MNLLIGGIVLLVVGLLLENLAAGVLATLGWIAVVVAVVLLVAWLVLTLARRA